MSNLYILYSKSKDLGDFKQLWKFHEISIFSFRENWDQSHNISYMVVRFPYKVMAETSNSNISKTTHRNIKIFSGMISLVIIFHFMQKKLGVKILANFPDYVPLTLCLKAMTWVWEPAFVSKTYHWKHIIKYKYSNKKLS